MGESNEAGDSNVAFAMGHNMRVVNTYFEKAERHKITYRENIWKYEAGKGDLVVRVGV